MRASKLPALLAVRQLLIGTVAAFDLPIAARTDEVESDFTAIFYNGIRPVLIGNDGGAASGGFRTFAISDGAHLTETKHETPGRTKLVTTVYGVDGKDLIVTIAQPESSLFRLYDASTVEQVGEPLAHTLGDWSALCAWRSPSSGEQYLYLFGKKVAVQFLLRAAHKSIEAVEVQTFETPVEASSCAVSSSTHAMFFSGDDDSNIYTFGAVESTQVPKITVLGAAELDVTGLAVYVGKKSDYLLVAQKNTIAFYNEMFNMVGSATLTGDDDIEIQGLSVYQSKTQSYPAGVVTYAIESDSGIGFGLSSLRETFDHFELKMYTAYNPRKTSCKLESKVCSGCNFNGFCERSVHHSGSPTCSCFAGFTGDTCESYTCRNNCSDHGVCIGANQCNCDEGWGGLYCAFKVVKAVAETDPNGGDGDDPAIWISPVDKAMSRIITTTKSDVGAGFGVFDLTGMKVQTIAAANPNNVDVIYNFRAGDKVIDLVYAACRKDNTLCLFEMSRNGTLAPIPGGIQPTKEDYEVYGSCVYRSRHTGKQYLFVNAKTAEYIQYELSWNHSSQALHTTLVRNFTGGSGGQVEGCVSDEANGWVIIGEEPRALWRYGAEPDDDVSEGFLIAEVGDGHTYADVEGVTLVEGTTANDGFILASQQGVSAYNVYRRAAPHEYVETFTIYENTEKGVDAVTNTDGITAVGASLGPDFPYGLIVVHDDVNQLPGSGTSDETSFKLISLGDVLSDDLLAEMNPEWDPRA
ncbi:phytase [Xylariaceae sp. AK1471]|nr:phytase [Xylariaceae sp. AK1471]